MKGSYTHKGRLIVLSKLVDALRRRGWKRGASLSNLSRVFSGDRNPTWELATDLAEIMGVTLDELRHILEQTAAAHAKWREADVMGDYGLDAEDRQYRIIGGTEQPISNPETNPKEE